MPIVEVRNLKRYYKTHKKEAGFKSSINSLFNRKYFDVKAVNNISFNVNEGELIGFIGPNGAGKTTTLKMLSGILYPTSGQISVLGFRPYDRKKEFLKNLSMIMGQKSQVWWDLPTIETLELNKEIYEIPHDRYQKTLKELSEMLEVGDLLKIQARKLSLGQRMKMEIIAALIHSPKVLFLDEPTIGLDVVAQKRLRDFIKEYNKKYGATVILTSHYMDDVKELCKRIIIIDKGTIIFDGKLEDVIKKYANHKLLTIVLKKKIEQKDLEKFGEVKEYTFPTAVIQVHRKYATAKATEILSLLPIADINIEEAKIEDIIREIFTGKDVA